MGRHPSSLLGLFLLLFAATRCSFESTPQPAASKSPANAAQQRPVRAPELPDVDIDATSDRTATAEMPRTTPDAGAVRVVLVTDSGSMHSPAMDAMDAGMSPARELDASTRPADAGAARPPLDAGTPKASQRDASMPMQPDAGEAGTASASLSCKPGAYFGTFSGSLQAGGRPVSTVSGPLNANLTLDAAGLYLQIRDLRVVGTDEIGNTMKVTVSGDINCFTQLLENGALMDGSYFVASTGTELAFGGLAQGVYSTDPYVLDGTWTVESQASTLLGGNGRFSLMSAP